ncbi:SWIM zinc finger family protein [Neobacillus vireti]|uniref:SWIM zinc finger family protein n=1 Tax=Neobacillus vireti TaxID=220686 RepID=UPI0030004074
MTANERIELLAEEIKELLHPHATDDVKLVQKGLMLYRQGLVKQLQVWNAQITATVQDVTPCYVKLNFAFLASSQCTCPHEGLCRHQMAVFFAAYSRIGSVADWVAEWREPMKEKSAVTNWGLQAAKDLIKANGVMKPDYRRWVESFEVSFDTILNSKKYSSPFIIAELFNIFERRIKASAPVEQEWRLLYEMVGIVVSFRKLAVLTEDAGFSEESVRRAYLSVFHNLIEDADELVLKIGVQSLPFDFDEFIMQLKDDVFELLTVSTGLEQERIYLYRLLWTNLFKKKEWREQESVRIHERMKSAKEWENLNPLMIAGVHISFLQQKDELALDLIDKIEDSLITPYMLHWIDLLSQTKSWKRVGPVVELFASKLKSYLAFLRTYHSCAAFTRSALKAISPYVLENGKIELYERAMLATLPYSYTEYEFLLFERKQFEKWGDLQAFMGWSYYDLPRERVKVIEKEKPEVLLGMLHQSALQEINQKNRSSYKAAVRHLKKLRTLYKKIKRVDDWQYFLNTLMDKTKRLRAFHEECRRSKLIEE